VRSAVAQNPSIQAKVEATWDPDDPVFTERERAALEMATLFTEDYRAVTDEHMDRWRAQFTDTELIELGTFLALADGFGKLVELLGLGDADQSCRVEI
jgi:alkylhydroperoxidase family enzyme